MSKSRALSAAVLGLLVAGWFLWSSVESVEPPAAGPVPAAHATSIRTGAAWSALPTADPTPPAIPKGEPPPRLGAVAGASAPLPGQPDVATIRADLERAKAVVR